MTNMTLSDRKRIAKRNLFILIPLLFVVLGFLLNIAIKEGNKPYTIEVSDSTNVHMVNGNDLKVIPLNEDAVISCVNGNKVIIVNKKVYYYGTSNKWGEIEGVECDTY